MALYQVGKDLVCEGMKDRRIAKKTGDMEQKVLVQGLYFLRTILQKGHIGSQVFHLLQGHTTLETTDQHARLVGSKIHPPPASQQGEQGLKCVLVWRSALGVLVEVCPVSFLQIGMAADPRQLLGNSFERQGRIHVSGGNRTLWHLRVAGSRFLLRKGHSPGCRPSRFPRE